MMGGIRIGRRTGMSSKMGQLSMRKYEEGMGQDHTKFFLGRRATKIHYNQI